MFTGIVEELGRFEGRDGDRYRIAATTVLEAAGIGDSTAVNGACLTVVALGDGWWETDVSDETAARTNLGQLAPGDPVNLERPVRMVDRLGGHIVLGHVDAVGEILAPPPDLRVRIPPELMRYCVEKGSITVDGISLTIFDLDADSFSVAIIPHTAAVTTLGSKGPGAAVNIEVDVMAKHVERLLAARLDALGVKAIDEPLLDDLAADAFDPGAGRGRGVMAWMRPALASLAGLLIFFGLSEAAVRVFDIPRYQLPAPSDIFRHIASDPAFYIENARTTIWEASLGFLLALVLALAAATAMAHSRLTEQMALPVVLLIQVTPIVAYAPVVVIWLGFGLKPILFLTSLVCFVPFLVNAVTGLRAVDPASHELLRSVDANRREIFFRLRVPHALPYLFAAARIAVGLALIGAVLGEFFAGTTAGLGSAIAIARNRNLIDQLWGCVFVLGFIGSVAVVLISGLERVTLRWHSSQDPVA